jgi:hypothetical protein
MNEFMLAHFFMFLLLKVFKMQSENFMVVYFCIYFHFGRAKFKF